jgi:outer membrane biosynthesis protein TonB
LSRLDFVGRSSASILAILLGALAALGLVACGGSDSADLLPGSTASEITANLDQVKELATAGDCVGAEDAAQAVSTQIEELGGVDKKLKQALREGATRLNEVVAGCEEAPEEETSPAIEPAEELEEADKPEKPAKQEKPEKEAVEPTEETSPALPPQAEGKAKGHEEAEEEAPPVETGGGTSAGGVGPGAPAESE